MWKRRSRVHWRLNPDTQVKTQAVRTPSSYISGAIKVSHVVGAKEPNGPGAQHCISGRPNWQDRAKTESLNCGCGCQCQHEMRPACRTVQQASWALVVGADMSRLHEPATSFHAQKHCAQPHRLEKLDPRPSPMSPSNLQRS